MIDIVLLWVDGNDPVWQAEYVRYAPCVKGDKREVRFRDWNNLRFLFRGIEKYAPWVGKVHFVTCGHVPEWLNLEAPKLHFVKHADFIPAEYLPTFNCNPIEMNIHRIKGLSDHFIYFNDDTFLIDHVVEERFFRDGLPCDIAALNTMQPNNSGIDHIICNDLIVINKYFSKRDLLKRHLGKWLNVRYASQWYRTLALWPWSLHTGFVDPHMPNAYLKSTFERVWELEPELLRETSASRFRDITNVNQYLMRYWRLCSGEFSPYNVWKDSEYVAILNDNLDYISDLIRNQRKRVICLNDSDSTVDFEKAKLSLIRAFESLLPDKSSFER